MGSIQFLIVSDVAGRSKSEVYHPGAKALERIITGMMDPIHSLRPVTIVERLSNHNDKWASCRPVETGRLLRNPPPV